MEFLDKTHTDQVRGLAIIFIIITHLWFHVSQRSPELILGREFFALFLILSGFGLSQSTLTSRPTFKQYLAKRVHRIYVPYWFITIIIVILDSMILNRTYSGEDLVLTFLGINISKTTRGIDYARWFITFLLFWYGIFFISTKFNSRFNKVLFLFSTAFVFFFFDYYVTRLGWHQIFAFPFGVVLAYYYKEITKYLEHVKKLKGYHLVPVVGLSVGVIYELYFGIIIKPVFPSILNKVIDEGVNLIFSFSIILLIGLIGYKNLVSKFISFVGIISYELYLLQGPFLIKYNPILSGNHLVVSFYFWLAIVLVLSYFFHKATLIMYKVGPIKYQDFG